MNNKNRAAPVLVRIKRDYVGCEGVREVFREHSSKVDHHNVAAEGISNAVKARTQATNQLKELHQLVRDVAPALLDLPGVGSEVAGQVLISIGDNADRLKSEAAFAHLCGAAPIPASSGRTHRHRLNRGANNALYVVVLGRMRHDARTRAYVARRTHEGLAKPEIIRCLKRYVAREIYNTLNLATPARKPEQLLARP